MLSVSVVIPTRNERDNITNLLSQVLPYGYEVVVVDDSDDDTAEIASSMGARVIRGQRKGLGQAIIDGINGSQSDVVLVMDADLSHDPKEIPKLLYPIIGQGADMVGGSRYCEGGDFHKWDFKRKIQSLVGVKLMQMVTGVTDSNSGFFAFRKSILNGVQLKPHSWKVMLEVLFKGAWVFKQEVPITFCDRYGGMSKNNNRERLRHAVHMFRLLAYKYRHFINFAIVGGIGSIWYYALLYTLTEFAGLWYIASAIVGTMVAITNNYLLNHYWTFKHKKATNSSLIRGWFKYVGNSALGDGVDLVVLAILTEVFGIWYMLSAFLASGVAAIIKYTIANRMIWKEKRTAHDADYEWYAYFKGLPWQKRWKRIIAGIVKEFAEYPNESAGRVLDCGCGSSPQGLLINHADYIGIDTNKAKVEYMKAKKVKDASYYHGDLDTITFLGTFDTILFVEVIEHLQDMSDAEWNLARMHKLLRQGGKLIVATPNFGGFMGKWMDRLYGLFQRNAYAKEHQLKFSLESLVSLCNRYGFKLKDYRIPSGADMVCLFEKE